MDADNSALHIAQQDPYLSPYRHRLDERQNNFAVLEKTLTQGKMDLVDFACGHLYFGWHQLEDQWILREWAPNAERMFLVGDMNDWQESHEFQFDKDSFSGTFSLRLPASSITHGQRYRLRLYWPGGQGDRLPSYAKRVVQNPNTQDFDAQIWLEPSYKWQFDKVPKSFYQKPSSPLLLYEAHVGMAQEAERVGSFQEFRQSILPRIVAAGYNAIQLMAIQEHPYYGSFGYQVANFFAVSSRFGTPNDLKELIDAAHAQGLLVIMDLVHSHAVRNELEGLSCFDGTEYQYFHAGPRGYHSAWDSRCFDYSKAQVLHFLLSNCKYWLEEFHLDGFRFDGVTSMIYRDHGLGKAFGSYEDYFGDNIDEDALGYLALANRLIHTIKPDALTLAEDVSGLPGLAAPQQRGGIGFNYRYSMGIADFWIKLLKEYRDEDWPMGRLWHELINRRFDEQTISYCECHDQALVGDKTLIFRLIDADMYHAMSIETKHLRVDRGIALHKLIRLLTLFTAGQGYLNFMGNEFGHPEWIDFPRQGNQWSFHFARRQWSLVDQPELRYQQLAAFDRAILNLAQNFPEFAKVQPFLRHLNEADKVLIFSRGPFIFAFNFHPHQSFTDYGFSAEGNSYRLVLTSDAEVFGGFGRLQEPQILPCVDQQVKLYLPARTGLVLQTVED